jgi:2,3-bisphosphoglycerate-dependent phosphoglycerate mutase
MKSSILLFAIALTGMFIQCSTPQNTEVVAENEQVTNPKSTTLILVRHAEKWNDTDTSTLTPEGMKRAAKLATFFQNTDINGIYTTPFPRVRMTAIPTAMSKNIEMVDYTPGKMEEIDVMINENIGKTALIIGHKNTIPEILNHYLNTKIQDLEEHSDIFILHIDNSNSKANSLTHLHLDI